MSGRVSMLGRVGGVPVYTAQLTSRSLTVEILTFGATLTRFSASDRRGLVANMCLGLPRLEQYVDDYRGSYVGCTMGRFSRLVERGSVTLDGAVHQLSVNEGEHHVHGGTEGFDRRVWDLVDSDQRRVVLRLESADGDQGYPGRLIAHACFELVGQADTLRVTYTATTDRSTLCDLVLHSFWNPGGSAPLGESTLRINAAATVDQDPTGVPTGGTSSVDDRTDFSAARVIGDTRLDDFFPLLSKDWAAQLCHEPSGRGLRITTSQPGLGVYSGDSPRLRRRGLCIQPSAWPYAPRRLAGPSSVLPAGDVYSSQTDYRVMAGGTLAHHDFPDTAGRRS